MKHQKQEKSKGLFKRANMEEGKANIIVAPFTTGYPHGTITLPDEAKETFSGYNSIFSEDSEFV